MSELSSVDSGQLSVVTREARRPQRCAFVRAAAGTVRCSNCGREVPTSDPPERVTARCRAGAHAAPLPRRPLCAHLGEESRRELCQTCAGHVELKVFQCELLSQECTVAKSLAGVANCCAICPHHSHAEQAGGERAIPEAPPATIERMAVITSYFNPQGYRRPRENYDRFAAAIAAAGLPLYTVELAFDDDEFQIPGAALQVRGTRARNLMFQKERLLNLLIAGVPALAGEASLGDPPPKGGTPTGGTPADAIAWIDADVLFLNPNWAAEARAELGRRQVAQLFDDSYQLLPHGALEKIRPSTAWHWRHQPHDPNFGRFDLHHPGFAWAARADWLRTHGLHDSMISGQGDCLMSMAFSAGAAGVPAVGVPALAGGTSPGVLRLLNPGWRAAFDAWARPAGEAVGGSMGHIRGALLHLYHGSFKNRRYRDRWRYLVEHAFDPAADLELDANGLWAWTRHALETKPAMVGSVIQNFAARKEDD